MNIQQLNLSDNLRFIINEIPMDFVSRESLDTLVSFCSSFPVLVSQDIGIEVKLSPVDSKADFAFSIEKNSAGNDLLLAESIRRISDGIPEWQTVKDTLLKWNADKKLNQLIKRLWLEFDHNKNGYNPVPSLFLEFEEGISGRRYESYSSFIQQDLSELSSFFNISETVSQEESLSSYLSAFDYTSPVYEIGKMLSRKNNGLRIIFADFGIHSIKELLDRIDFTGNINRAEQLYNDARLMFDYLIMHVNQKENTDYFAIECYFNNKNSIDKEPRWFEVIKYLENKFGIDKEKFIRLLNYPGVINTDHSYPFTIIKRFNHIKLILKDESKAEVKVYLGMRADYK